MKSLSFVVVAAGLLGACSNSSQVSTSKTRDVNNINNGGLAAEVEKLEAILLKHNVQPEARHNNESYTDSNARWMNSMATNSPGGLSLSGQLTSRDSATNFSRIDLSKVPTWTDAQLATQFQAVRDAANWQMNTMPGQARRSSWMYPDDGCYMRAGLMSDLIEANGLARPAKVFSYGNLSVQTVNGVGGSVQWGYHVAPVVHTPTGYYVIDPAINPDQPTELQHWLLTQVATLDDVNVSICNPHAFAPDSDCASGNDDGPAVTVDLLQNNFLGLEWQRQIDLGRDPSKLLLGTDGSWKHP